jgi:anthranilate phosphoribosyltransferase
LNAGAAMYVAGLAADLRSGLDKSREVLRSGAGLAILETLAQRSRERSGDD